MTTTNTLDVIATAKQSIELAEAGCEIGWCSTNVRAAQALGDIRKKIRAEKVEVP